MDFRVDRGIATLYLNQDDIWDNTCNYKSYQEFLYHQFDRNGYILSDKPSLKMMRTDSDFQLRFEISCPIGENCKPKVIIAT